MNISTSKYVEYRPVINEHLHFYGLSGAKIVLPDIVNLGERFSGVGVTIENCTDCDIYLGNIERFEVGLRLIGNDRGCVHNRIHGGHLEENKINLQMIAKSTNDLKGGWCNENTFIGTRCSHWSKGNSYRIPGFRHIQMIDQSGYAGPNSNKFFGLSLEGLIAEYVVEIDGSYNDFYSCRWEGKSNGLPNIIKVNSGHSNNIFGGYAYNVKEHLKIQGSGVNLVPNLNPKGNPL